MLYVGTFRDIKRINQSLPYNLSTCICFFLNRQYVITNIALGNTMDSFIFVAVDFRGLTETEIEL